MTAWARRRSGRWVVLLSALTLVLAACGGDDEPADDGDTEEPADDGDTEEPADDGDGEDGEDGEAAADCEWPTEDVNFWVNRAPGGGHDATVRGLAPIFEEVTGYNFVVDNEDGAGGLVGAQDNFAQGDNAHFLSLWEPGGLLMYSMVNDDPGFDLDEATVLGQATQRGMTIVASPEIGVETWQDVVDLSEEQDILYAATGPGSVYYNLMNIIFEYEGMAWNPVPHGGSGETIPALVRGDAHILGQNTETNAIHINDGDVLGLVQYDDPPFETIPDVPQGTDVGHPEEWTGALGDLLWVVAPPDVSDCEEQVMQETFEEVMNHEMADEWVEQTGRSLVYASEEDTRATLEVQRGLFEEYIDLIEENVGQ